MFSRRPRYADVAATLALVIALGGTAAAATGNLPRKSVGSGQLKVGAVINPKLANHAVGARNMKPLSVARKDLIGMDAETTISINVGAGACARYLIDTGGAKGGATGQPAFLAFTGSVATPIPNGLTVSPFQLDDGSAGEAIFCNSSGSAIVLNNQPISILSFGN